MQFREAVAARGDSAPARLGLANALLAQKKYEAGSDALAEYLKLNPERPRRALRPRFRAARSRPLRGCARRTGPRRGRLRAYGRRAEDARRNLYATEKVERGGEALTQAIRLSPQDPELPAWLGHVDIELHEYPAAINILSQVYTQNPQSPMPCAIWRTLFF